MGWAQLGAVGSSIAKQAPEFDARNYGYTKLGELVRATKLFDFEEFFEERSGRKSVYGLSQQISVRFFPVSLEV